MLFASGCAVLVSPVIGKWIDRVGLIWPLMAGSICMVVSAVLLTVYFIGASVPVIGAILGTAGVSYGVLNVTLQAAMMKLSPPAIIGVSAGLFQTSRYLGSILSAVVLGLVFGSGISSTNMQSLGYTLIIISLIGCLIGFYLWKRLRQS
ncbi:MAG: putative transporter [Firmicutes bacterium]|nr:putative transporter [Bacillota bacterium]